MNQALTHVCVATIGGQPQVATLTLDVLFDQGVPIDELIVVHLALDNPRYQAAYERLAHEFAGASYQGRPCRYFPISVRYGPRIVHDIDSSEAMDAARNTFDALFARLKDQGCIIHLCISGGRRLLGHLALAMAYQHFDYTDRVWHLFSSDEVREQTRDGARMHLDDCSGISLLRLPFEPRGQRTVISASFNARQSPEDQARCRQVYDGLSPRLREVLRAFADGLSPKEVAQKLCIAEKTVQDHRRAVFDQCAIAWELPPDHGLRYTWLREKFAPFLEV